MPAPEHDRPVGAETLDLEDLNIEFSHGRRVLAVALSVVLAGGLGRGSFDRSSEDDVALREIRKNLGHAGEEVVV